MDEERQRRWRAHCERMAEATHAIADWCEDLEMMGTYLTLAAQWMRMANEGPPTKGEPGGGPGLH